MFKLAAIAAVAANAAVPEQISIHPTKTAGVLSVDFVAAVPDGSVSFAVGAGAFTTVNTTSFKFETIGYMHQAVMDMSTIAPDTKAVYRVATSAGSSTTFSITPIVSLPKYAIYGDFGLVNDECMDDIIKFAQAGSFDTVLHVGCVAAPRFPHLYPRSRQSIRAPGSRANFLPECPHPLPVPSSLAVTGVRCGARCT
jgi:hypothetical protein